MDRFVKGMCAAVIAWSGWISVALYVSSTRALPDAPPVHMAKSQWCDLPPASPLIAKPQHNYDYRMGTRYKGTEA